MPPSFAEEVAASRSGGKAAAPPPPSAGIPAPPASAISPATPPAVAEGFGPMPKHGDVYVEPLPPGNAPVEPVPVAAAAPIEPMAATPAAPPPEGTPAPADAKVEPPSPDAKAPIRIGSREFTDVTAAIEYARELELSKVADQAFIEGVKTATPKAPEAAVETAAQKLARDIFIDPEKAALEFQASIEKKLRDEYNASVTAQQKAQVQAQQRANIWDGFFKDNPDLSAPETRQLVQEYIYPKNVSAIGHMQPQEGLKELARLARKTLQIQKEAAVPKQTLSSAPVVTTGATTGTTPAVTAPPAFENVDFVTAVNNLRRKRT